MGNYAIDPAFRAVNFSAPLNRPTAYAARAVLKGTHRRLRKQKGLAFTTEAIPVAGGTISLHVLTPRQGGGQKPALLYLHGGGFVFDAAPYQYHNAARYAVETGSVVLFPRYRLTPTVAAPTPGNDCAAAWDWAFSHAADLGLDPEKIGVGGDSAGGYLAAQLVNRALRRGEPVRYQLLVYPVIDAAQRTESMQKYPDTPLWNARLNRVMWEWYDPQKQEPNLLDEPLPAGLPASYVETAEFDCLHDEGLLYAEKLRASGAATTVNETHGTIHGFDLVSCAITEAALAARVRFIRGQLADN